MYNLKKIKITSFLILLFVANILLFLPNKTMAIEPNEVPFVPQISIPNSEFQQTASVSAGSKIETATGTILKSDLAGRYIIAIYTWAMSIVGVIGVLILMGAGILWMTSGGDSGKISKAKDLITGSISGIALLIGSWLLLNTINPNLTKLPAIEMQLLKNKNNITICKDSYDEATCIKLGTCYWKDNTCISKADSGAVLCSENKSEILEKFPQCCCEQKNNNYVNCKWSVRGRNTYCSASCGSTYTSTEDRFCP